MTAIAQFGHIGITDATAYFQRKTGYNTAEVYNTNFFFLIFIFIIIFTAVLVLKSSGMIFPEYEFIMVMFVLVSVVLFTLINDLMTATYISSEKIIQLNNRILFSSIIVNAVYFILWILGMLNTTSYLIVFALNPVMIYILLSLKMGISLRFAFNFKLLKEQFSYGIVVYFAVLFLFFSFRIDQWMIKHFLSNADLGIYAIGVTISELMLIIPTSFVNPFRARLYNISYEDPEYKKITEKTVKFTFYAVLLISVAVFFASGLIPGDYLYGPKYDGSVAAVRILVTGVIFTVFGTLGIHYFIISGNPKVIFLINLTVLVFSIVLNFFMIPRFGVKGAATASAISHFLYGAIYIGVFYFREKINPIMFFRINKNEIGSLFGALKLYLRKT